MRTRNIDKHIRLSPEEDAYLRKQMKLTGLSADALIRILIMGTDVKPIPPEQLAGILRQLSAIGNNINQIARVANGTGRVSKEDIDAIKSMQAQMWNQLKTL